MNLVISMVRIFNPMNEELKNLWIVKMTTSRAWLEPLAIPSVRHCDDISNWSAFAEQRKKHETPTFFPGHVLVCWVGHLSPKCFSSSTQYYHIQWFNTYYYYTNCWWNWSQFCPRWMNLTDIVFSFRQNYLFLETEFVDWCRYDLLEWFGGCFFWCVYLFQLTYYTTSTYVFLKF